MLPGGSTKVDIDQAVKNYEQALSQYNQTKIEIDSFSSSGTLAKLETQRRILEAQVALSEKSLSEKKIAAPYLGVITNVYVNEGGSNTGPFSRGHDNSKREMGV